MKPINTPVESILWLFLSVFDTPICPNSSMVSSNSHVELPKVISREPFLGGYSKETLGN